MNLCFLLLCVLLSASSCSADKGAQAGIRATSGTVTIQPWLVGLTAVVGFLFIVFVLLIINRLFRKNRKDKDQWAYDKAQELEGDDKQTSL